MPKERPRTKIVCTLGPSSSSSEVIFELVEAGMSVARLNMEYGTIEEHEGYIDMALQASTTVGQPVAIMVDVPGPKYRTGQQEPEVIDLRPGASITLTSREIPGSAQEITVQPCGIHLNAESGDCLLLNDGLIALAVESVKGEDVLCTVMRGGNLTEKSGVAVPKRKVPPPFPTDQGRAALEFAAERGADFVALSMVSKGADVCAARKILQERGHVPSIISKIELPEGVKNFKDILRASDGIMVARGDMGVEMPVAEVPIIQKNLIAQCNAIGKPVITATQMLESMTCSPMPTRAEVTDVANAIFDGTDAIMLSGETAKGDYPVEAVRVMAEVARVAEDNLPYQRMMEERRAHVGDKIDDAISYTACHVSQQLGLPLIVAFTESGSTAGRVSKYRPQARIIALTRSESVRRKLVLTWGATPFTVPHIEQGDDFFRLAEQFARDQGGAKSGESVALVAGLPIGVPGGTNLLRVLTLE